MFAALFRIMSTFAGWIVILIGVLAGVAEILSFALQHPNVFTTNLQNIAGYFASPPANNSKCERYDTHFEPVDCDAKKSPSERLLCKVTVPPVKKICVEQNNGH